MNHNNTTKFPGGRIEGVGTISGGKYDEIRINGVCTVEGDLEAESLYINGVCTCNGNVFAESFACDGVLTIQGNLRGGTIDIDGVVKVHGAKVEATRIDCDGVLTIPGGEVSADVVDADGSISAAEIVGDQIKIKSYWKNSFVKLLFKLGEKINMKLSVIDIIEGTTVELQGVRAKTVNGKDVYIGKNCEIEHVDASGELKIHPSAIVTAVTG